MDLLHLLVMFFSLKKVVFKSFRHAWMCVMEERVQKMNKAACVGNSMKVSLQYQLNILDIWKSRSSSYKVTQQNATMRAFMSNMMMKMGNNLHLSVCVRVQNSLLPFSILSCRQSSSSLISQHVSGTTFPLPNFPTPRAHVCWKYPWLHNLVPTKETSMACRTSRLTTERWGSGVILVCAFIFHSVSAVQFR